MANEMPFDILGQALYFASQLLLMTLTKHALSLLISCSDVFLRMELTNGNQSHPLGERLAYFV